MTTQTRGPLAGFGWLKRGINVAFRCPMPMFGGAALLMIVVCLPWLFFLPFQPGLTAAGRPPDPAVYLWIVLPEFVLGLLIVPLYAGYLQVIDATERGLPARIRDVFRPYRDREALRLIGFGAVLIVLYFALAGIIVMATGGAIAHWYVQVLSAQVSHQPPPGLPPGSGTAVALFIVMALFMMGFYPISLGQVALRRRGVFAAIGEGAIGAFKNVLPLVVLAVSLVVAWVLAVIALVIVGVLIALLGILVGKWLIFVLLVPAYIALVLITFAVMFGVMYHLWRDVCAHDDNATGTVQTITA